MDAAEARLVTSPACLALIDTLPPYDAASALTLGQGLRDAGGDPALVAAAMTQSRLRSKARAKFGEFAAGMVFTQEGLEQATRLAVAARHGVRFRDAGITSISDLTCGIGADAMAAASLGLSVVAFEIDEPTALMADHNLRHWPDVVVVLGDSLAAVRGLAVRDPGSGGLDVGGVFADPARRSGGSRRHDPADYSPNLASVLELRDQFPALGVKVGPGIPHAALPQDAETQWVSVDGDVVEAAIWCGPLAHSTGRSALLLGKGGAHTVSDTGALAGVGAVGSYVIEPDGAIIRAGLVAEVATRSDGWLMDPTIAYITTDSAPHTALGDTYRVLDSMPFSVKTLKAYLRARGVGRVTIKKRGTAVTPESLRSQLALKGNEEATVMLTRIAGKHSVLIVESVRHEAQ